MAWLTPALDGRIGIAAPNSNGHCQARLLETSASFAYVRSGNKLPGWHLCIPQNGQTQTNWLR